MVEELDKGVRELGLRPDFVTGKLSLPCFYVLHLGYYHLCLSNCVFAKNY